MSIAIKNQVIGDIRPRGSPFGVPGIAVTRLKFPLTLQLDALADPAAYLTQFLAEISVTIPGQTPRSLGRAQPHASWVVGTFEHAQSQPFELWLDVSGEQLEALERQRVGQQLEFHVDLHLQIHYRSAIHSARADVRFHVNESAWAEVLRQVGHLDHLLVAVELPLDAPEQMRKAVQYIRSAHQNLTAGRYADAVRVCRLAMESLLPLTDDAAGKAIRIAFAGGENVRRQMSTAQRAELVRLAVHHFANPAHHEDPGKPAEVYSRQDALFILSAAAGVVWEAIGRHNAMPSDVGSPRGTGTS